MMIGSNSGGGSWSQLEEDGGRIRGETLSELELGDLNKSGDRWFCGCYLYPGTL